MITVCSVVDLISGSFKLEWLMFVLLRRLPVCVCISCMLAVLVFSDWSKFRRIRLFTVASCAMALMTNSSL